MLVSRFSNLLKVQTLRTTRSQAIIRNKGTNSILPEPPITRFGFLGIVTTVITGLLIGAAISKSMANFLEENELFVPSDDDDDDD